MKPMQEYFKNSNGEEVLDTPDTFELLADPRSEKVINEKYGEKFIVKLRHFATQEETTWEAADTQLDRVFKKTDRTGKVLWEANVGDLVEIRKATPQGSGRPYWVGNRVDTTQPIISPNMDAAPVAQVKRVISSSEPQWDGSPRQQSFRNGLREVACAMLIQGAEFSDGFIERARSMFMSLREEADRLESAL